MHDTPRISTVFMDWLLSYWRLIAYMSYISISKWASMGKYNHIPTSMPSNFSKAWDPSVLPSPHHHHQASWDKNLSYCAAMNDWRSTILGWEISPWFVEHFNVILVCCDAKPLSGCQWQVKLSIGVPYKKYHVPGGNSYGVGEHPKLHAVYTVLYAQNSWNDWNVIWSYLITFHHLRFDFVVSDWTLQ